MWRALERNVCWVLAFTALALGTYFAHRFIRARQAEEALKLAEARAAQLTRDRMLLVRGLAKERTLRTRDPVYDVDEFRKWAVASGKAQPEDFESARDGQRFVLVDDAMGDYLVMEQTGQRHRKYIYRPPPEDHITEMWEADIEELLRPRPRPRKTPWG